ncbi:MAG: zinc ribbon domain-containing protein [Myxococcota bacterium]
MSLLAPLLQIQELDLAVDALRQKAATLPERAALPKLAKKLAAVDAELAKIRAEGQARVKEESELGQAVSQVAKEIEAAEVERYSGKRIDRDEAAEHKASQAKLREQQEGFEEKELELLLAIEELEAALNAANAARSENLAETETATKAIAAAEAEVESEIAALLEQRAGFATGIPAPVLSAYDRVRGQERARGRGVAPLEEGRCTGCRIKLPSIEFRKMIAEPEEALLQCPQCRRVLIRQSA